MTAQLRCTGCGHRFGKRSRALVIVGAALCRNCGDDPAVHRRLLWTCPDQHAPRSHDGATLASVARARELLNANRLTQRQPLNPPRSRTEVARS